MTGTALNCGAQQVDYTGQQADCSNPMIALTVLSDKVKELI